MNIDVNAKGSSYKAPYSTIFHEAGHAIDGLTAHMGNTNGLWHFSSTYKNGLFPTTIKAEVQDWAKIIQDDMKAHITDFSYWVKKGWITQSVADYYSQINGFKVSKSMAYNVIQKEIKSLKPLQLTDISDILEGATRGKVVCGVGHGAGSYWTKRIWNGIDYGLGTEAFAEMTSATMTNPESLITIQKYLPKSYAVYQEMIELIANQI